MGRLAPHENGGSLLQRGNGDEVDQIPDQIFRKALCVVRKGLKSLLGPYQWGAMVTERSVHTFEGLPMRDNEGRVIHLPLEFKNGLFEKREDEGKRND
ncbi:hypothetical protein TNCV_4018621 [Trichonephila clavipes]|nr:hypothetical protein TNCV_4018621 [Trichonephila clavipes]